VSRVRAGDPICLFNGNGYEYSGKVAEISRGRVLVEIVHAEQVDRELGFRLVAGLPVPKGNRAQFLVEKLTETGVTDFVPLSTARSVVMPREAKMEKLERYVIEASKQCGRNVLMKVHPIQLWAEWCRLPEHPKCKRLAHPGTANTRTQTGERSGSVFAVGPEGGFTSEEIMMGRDSGWEMVNLGPRILRVETAALVLAAQLGQFQLRS
jgi:16S rRNA (uracil1498-N3)-methyltransferase